MQKKVHYDKITKIVKGFYLIDQDAPTPFIIIDENNIPSYFEKLIVNTKNNTISIVQPTIEEIIAKIKIEKLQDIDLIKKQKLYEPLQYKSYILHGSEKAQTNIIGRLLSVYENNEWLDIYGNNIEFTKIEFQEIRNLFDDRSLFVYKTEATLIKLIYNATTKEELDNINIQNSFNNINKIEI